VQAFYAQIKAVHVAAVLLSGALFLARGSLVLAGRTHIAMLAPVRYASYGIDTVLLTAALMLVSALPAGMFANHWLSIKLALLVVYVVLGTLALRRAATPQRRRLSFLCALGVYVAMIGIARAHHPLGWLRAWFG
jgi:uncharacterized membrane protein SirB2